MKTNNLIQERNILILPIGLERDRVIKSCRVFPANIVYLLYNPSLHNDEVGLEYYSNLFRDSVKSEFEQIFSQVKPIECDLGSFSESIMTINKIFQIELKSGALHRIIINISTASKVFAIAAYIFATQHPNISDLFYMSTKQYTLLNHLKKNYSIEDLIKDFKEHGLTKGPYDIIRIPIIRSIEYEPDEIRLLQYLNQHQEIRSLKSLMHKLKIQENAGSRIKLRRMLDKFESEGLITITREKKIIIVRGKPILSNLVTVLPINEMNI